MRLLIDVEAGLVHAESAEGQPCCVTFGGTSRPLAPSVGDSSEITCRRCREMLEVR